VFTYPAGDWRKQINKLFRFGVVSWSRLRKRIIHEFGPIQYIQTWEVHKSGVPHVNVVISNQSIFESARWNLRALKRDWLEPAVVGSGFGKISYMRPIYDKSGMAGYLTKLCRELTGATVKDQVPVNAPPHFRRLRASRGLLAPRHKQTSYTGRIVQSPLPQRQACGKMVNGVDPGWLQERLLLEEMECLQQRQLPLFST